MSAKSSKDSQYSKAYRLRHPEKRRESLAKYYRNNREKVLAKNREYDRLHRDKKRAYSVDWAKRNPEKCAAKAKAWRQRHPDKVRARKVAHKQCDPVSANVLTQLIQSLPKMRCALCSKNMAKNDRTIDHVIPFSRGGAGDIGNLQVVHRGCNSQKKAKMPHELDGQMQIHLVGRVA